MDSTKETKKESNLTSPHASWDLKSEDVKIEEVDEEGPSSSQAWVASGSCKIEDTELNSYSGQSSENENDENIEGSGIERPQHCCKYSSEITCCKHELSELVKQEEGLGTSFKCFNCEHSFTTDCGLYLHLMKKHCQRENRAANGYRCSICRLALKNWRRLAGHMIKNHDIRYSQMLMPTPSLREGMMTILLKKKDGGEPVNAEMGLSDNEQFSCASCHKAFFFKHDLLDHVQDKHKHQKHQCSKCKVGFKNKRLLMEHRLKAHAVDDFIKCILCEKRCPTDIGLYTHMLTKHNPKVEYREQKAIKMICSICGIQEKGGVRLAKHMIHHHFVSGSQLSLPTPRSTSTGVNMTIMVLDRKEKEAQLQAFCRDSQYRCLQCGRPFFRQQQLIGHMQDVHGVDASLKCPNSSCCRSFTSDQSLYSHTIKVHTPKMYAAHRMSCNICGLQQNGGLNLAKHMVNDHSLTYGMLSMPTFSANDSNVITILVNKDASGSSIYKEWSNQAQLLHYRADDGTATATEQQPTSAPRLQWAPNHELNTMLNSQYLLPECRNQRLAMNAKQPKLDSQSSWKQQQASTLEQKIFSSIQPNENQSSLYQMSQPRNQNPHLDTGEQEYCSICDRFFNTEGGFYSHNMSKHCEKGFRSGGMACSLCETFFCTGAPALVKHMVNEHQLSFGSLSLPHPSSNHVDMNTISVQEGKDVVSALRSEDEYECIPCGVKFSSLSAKRNHFGTYHPVLKQCWSCFLFFKNKKELRTHPCCGPFPGRSYMNS